MAMTDTHKRDILFKEIDNLETLLIRIDEGNEQLDALQEQKQKILDVLPVPTISNKDPIHILLSCEPLTKTEIPLDVLEKLIESPGFDVNARFGISEDEHDDAYFQFRHYSGFLDFSIYTTCLNLAIQNGHYSAARCLVQHGADCEVGSIKVLQYDDDPEEDYTVFTEERTEKTPIAELAVKANVPLDLFDLLATPRTLKNNGDTDYLPLHLALGKGHSESALRLIKLGADVNLKNSSNQLPVELYERSINVYHEYHDQLFLHLIPSDTMDVFQCVERLVRTVVDTDNQIKMIHRLFQNIKAVDHLHIHVAIDPYSHFIKLVINSKLSIQTNYRSKQSIYWWSLLLLNLGWKFESTPQAAFPLLPDSALEDDVELARKIDDIWSTYRDVLSLQNVCIQQVRRCMRDFSHDSFTSLPVPKKLRRLLMYQHVAEIACEPVKCRQAEVELSRLLLAELPCPI